MKPITRTLISMYAAMHMLASGCSTSRHFEGVKPGKDPELRFVDRNPQTFTEISDAVEEGEKELTKVQEYNLRFKKIKRNIALHPDYNAHYDMRILVNDVLKSDLENKVDVANEFKNYGYHINYGITKSSGFAEGDGIEFGEGAAQLGAICAIGYIAYQFFSEDGFSYSIPPIDPKTDLSKSVFIFLGVSVGSWGIMNAIDFGFAERSTRSRDKVYIRPYHDKDIK